MNASIETLLRLARHNAPGSLERHLQSEPRQVVYSFMDVVPIPPTKRATPLGEIRVSAFVSARPFKDFIDIQPRLPLISYSVQRVATMSYNGVTHAQLFAQEDTVYAFDRAIRALMHMAVPTMFLRLADHGITETLPVPGHILPRFVNEGLWPKGMVLSAEVLAAHEDAVVHSMSGRMLAKDFAAGLLDDPKIGG